MEGARAGGRSSCVAEDLTCSRVEQAWDGFRLLKTGTGRDGVGWILIQNLGSLISFS